jgi:hypothetical protein
MHNEKKLISASQQTTLENLEKAKLNCDVIIIEAKETDEATMDAHIEIANQIQDTIYLLQQQINLQTMYQVKTTHNL